MARGALNVTLENESEIAAQLKSLPDGGKKALQGTVNQLRNRVPAWVGQEVSKIYSIKKAEIKASATKKGAGAVSIAGNTVDSLYLEYKGRVLTPTHFKMKPKAPKGKAYQVTAEVYKGQRKTLSPIAFLGQSGGGDTPYIPFQRTETSRLPIEAIKTVSIPQMIDNEEVNDVIYNRIEEEAVKVLNNQISRYMK
ncbi:MAG: hypothetical protein K5900_11495 [Butyrivibrio sp.]|nr:hypothetical protein [Butyrivibrio sp.]